jgi:hypothetical protein
MQTVELLAVTAAIGFSIGQISTVHADEVDTQNIVKATADKAYKDFELAIKSMAKYTVNKDGTILILNPTGDPAKDLKKAQDPTVNGDGTGAVTLTWKTPIAKGDVTAISALGKTDKLAEVSYTPKFTDDTSVPDLGWVMDSSGDVSLVNGFASAVHFDDLVFDIQPSDILTFAQVYTFVLGSASGMLGTVTSGDIPGGGSLFVGTFSPDAALIARFDSNFLDSSFSPLTARDGLAEASSITVPEPSTWSMMGLGFAGLAFAGYRARRSALAAA